MLADFVLAQAAPIVENRIKDIFQGIAKEYNLNALDIEVMMRMEHNEIMIYAFKDKRKIKRIMFSEIKGNVGNIVENKIKEIFRGTALKSNANIAYTNFILKLRKNGIIQVYPYVNNVFGDVLTIKQLLNS